MQNEIILFLDAKAISHDFITKIGCDKGRYEMMLAADVFEKLNELNTTLQGKGFFCTWNLEVNSSKAKLDLFAKEANEDNLLFPFIRKTKSV